MIRQFLLCLTLCVVLSVTGCGGKNGSERYFAYCADGFFCEVRGEVDGVALRAEVTYVPHGTSAVRYLSPASLRGLCVEVTDGAARATLNGLAFAADADTLAGVLRPLTLLTACSREVRTVEKSDGRTALTLADGTRLSLSPKGAPLSVTADGVRLEVVAFATLPPQ